jgi:hypothetical protein
MVLCHLESAEESDSNETLELDDEQYPILPENVLELRLHRRKAVLRQYMAAVRRTYSARPILHCDRSSWLHRIPTTSWSYSMDRHCGTSIRPSLQQVEA